MVKKISNLKLGLLMFFGLSFIGILLYVGFFFTTMHITCNVTDLYTNQMAQISAEQLKVAEYTSNTYIFFIKNITELDMRLISMDSMNFTCFIER